MNNHGRSPFSSLISACRRRFARLLTLRSAFTALAAVQLAAQGASLPAFPGAEGYGADASGGRGGDVYTVTNLKPSGEGSFAAGVATVPPAGRTIVFAVSGCIPINKLKLKASNVTIAGQTAPGGGVALQGSCFWISGSNVVVRHLRFRHGRKGNGGDALETDSGAARLVLDHCDALFSADENFSMFKSAPPTFTFQWCINAWGLQRHSAGGLWLVDHTTAHHSLWAHNHTRNPKVIRPLAFDWANNVTFGWDIGMNLAGADVAGTYRVNLRGNTFVHGGKARDALFGGGRAPDGTVPFQLYMHDNAFDGNGNGVLDVTATDFGLVATNDYRRSTVPFPQTASADPSAKGDPLLGVPVTVDERVTAYQKVISQAGPLRLDVDPACPLRDEVDALVIRDVVSQRRRIIADEAELGLTNGGFGELRALPAPQDSDRDGMPDYYEAALGWNPAAQDHNALLQARNGAVEGLTFFPAGTPAGYTRLEEYLHFMAVPHGVVPRRSAAGARPSIVVDLRKFTCGFTAAPSFTVANVSGGTVAQEGPGGALAAFSPTPGYAGRARFDFTVRDSAGRVWTQTCALVVADLEREARRR